MYAIYDVTNKKFFGVEVNDYYNGVMSFELSNFTTNIWICDDLKIVKGLIMGDITGGNSDYIPYLEPHYTESNKLEIINMNELLNNGVRKVVFTIN